MGVMKLVFTVFEQKEKQGKDRAVKAQQTTRNDVHTLIANTFDI